jgi:predicted metal-dependent hydrolase
MTISYLTKQSKRSRRVRISISGGRVIVTAPLRVNKEHLDRIVADHEAWINKVIRRYKKMTAGVKLSRDVFDKKEFMGTVKAMVDERYRSIAAPFGVRLGHVAVKKMRSRWGSCSSRGNISINLLLGHLPAELLEYVVIHEICHLVHHNHSKLFWSLVAASEPAFKTRKAELRRYSHFLASNDPPRTGTNYMVK